MALTAHAMLGDREKCIQAQMDEYLSKPLKQNTLIQVILKVITRNGRCHPDGIWGDKSNRLTNIGTVRDSWGAAPGKRQRTSVSLDAGRQRAGEQGHKRSKHDEESATTGVSGDGDSSDTDPDKDPANH